MKYALVFPYTPGAPDFNGESTLVPLSEITGQHTPLGQVTRDTAHAGDPSGPTIYPAVYPAFMAPAP